MQYISTRGEASSLGFADAMLAGLARDGGLYVPDAWPRLDIAAIAGFAGRSYAEVAVEIIRRCTGAATLAEIVDDLARAYAAPRERVLADTTALLAGLADKKLLELSL